MTHQLVRRTLPEFGEVLCMALDDVDDVEGAAVPIVAELEKQFCMVSDVPGMTRAPVKPFIVWSQSSKCRGRGFHFPVIVHKIPARGYGFRSEELCQGRSRATCQEDARTRIHCGRRTRTCTELHAVRVHAGQPVRRFYELLEG